MTTVAETEIELLCVIISWREEGGGVQVKKE